MILDTSETVSEPSQHPNAACDDSQRSSVHTALARLAAKARIVETLSSGDVRVLAAELREGLEVLCGPTADVVSILGKC